MYLRGLEPPREMWAALQDHGRIEQTLWDMALRQIHEHGCAACNRRRYAARASRSFAGIVQPAREPLYRRTA